TSHALIEHWNGTAWSVVTTDTMPSSLMAVAAIATNDVWAVGQRGTQTLTEHWDGITWSVVPSPNGGTLNDGLSGVSAVTSADLWAVGFDITAGPSLTLIEHWNGTRWSVVPSPNPSATLNFLNGVAADHASGQTWAVGDVFSS